jgi:hypothetical protein
MVIIIFMQARDVEQVSRTATTHRNSSQVSTEAKYQQQEGAAAAR